jgi:beta-galactosidase/beta-glucuronidase
MPADWGEALGSEFRGRVEYRRRFGCPTGIGEGQRVWLVCDGADAWAALSLNGQPLGDVEGPATPSEFDVTVRLQERNEIAATVECPRRTADGQYVERGERASLPGGLIGETRLEIRDD